MSAIEVGIIICVAVVLGISVASGPVAPNLPDERIAANRAEQFALAVVSDELEYAYDLLDFNVQLSMRPKEFAEAVAKLHPNRQMPVDVVARAFAPVTDGRAVDIFLDGERGSHHFYYRFRMSGSGTKGYRVAVFERSESSHPSTLAKIPPAMDSLDMRSAPVTARLVLVPIEADEQRVKAVAATFRERLGLPVQILAPMVPDAETAADFRKQRIAEALLDQMRRVHEGVDSTEADTLVGITGEDVYIQKNPAWRFALSYRERPSAAIVSYARMDPRRLGGAPNEALLRSRLIKMVAKNVGLLMYGLRTSTDPKSILFDGILGVHELDFVELSFSRAGMRAETSK